VRFEPKTFGDKSMKTFHQHILTAIAASVLATQAFAQKENASAAVLANISARPDALLQIDMNRTRVVERIFASWKSEIPAAQHDSMKQKLEGLRSDQLLAATLAGSFDGVLEIVNAKEVAKMAHTEALATDTAKTLGSLSNDFVYTPITPCRLVDTRGSFSPVYSGGAYAPSASRNYFPSGSCGVPSGATAVALQITTILPPGAGDIELVPAGTTLGSTAAMVFSANQYNSVSTIVKLGTGGGFTTQMRGGGGHVAMDMVGYFAPPEATTPDCVVFSAFDTFGNNSGYKFVIPDSCTSGRVSTSRSCFSSTNDAGNYLQSSGPRQANSPGHSCEWWVGGTGFIGYASHTCCKVPGR
jgi:hypothetical protein